MKVHMAVWVGGIKNLPAWFEHGKDIDVTFTQLKELYDTGNNVMLCHYDHENILWVDSKRFTQR